MGDRKVGNYVVLDHGNKDTTCWPSPMPDNDLEWRCRYAPETITEQDKLHIASILSAYEYMITTMTQKQRNSICSRIKAVLASEDIKE